MKCDHIVGTLCRYAYEVVLWSGTSQGDSFLGSELSASALSYRML